MVASAARIACDAIKRYCSEHNGEYSQEDVNAYGNYGNTGWIKDYKKRSFQLYYALRLFERRVMVALEAFYKYLDKVKADTTVVSIGCGPGPELAAAYAVLKSIKSVENVKFLGIDCERGWKKLFQAWTIEVKSEEDRFSWRTKKITNEKKLIKLLKEQNASVVIFSYFLFDFGIGLNPSQLMERVPSLRRVIVFDNQRILRDVEYALSPMATIYRDDYLYQRTYTTYTKSWVEEVQVLAYSHDKMITTLGFAIKLRSNRNGSHKLYLQAGHFKHVKRSIANKRSFRTLVVPFAKINFRKDKINFRKAFVKLVAPRLADVLDIPEARARTIVINFSKTNGLDEDDRDLIEGLLALRSCSPMSRSYKFAISK